MFRRLLMSGVVLALCACSAAEEDTAATTKQPAGLRAHELASGLAHPWGLAFLPDGRILITEKIRHLRIFDPTKGLLPEPVEGLPEFAARGQGGLLDVALHPDYDNNGWVYLSYAAENDGKYGTEVGRGKLVGNQLQDFEVIFIALPKTSGSNHFGSRLVFDNNGYLFITLGERDKKEPAQDLSNHLGSVIRLHDDGSIPEDNPFVNTENARPEIYSYGHRNVQGAALNPFTGELWTHEHGPQGGDEVNIIKPGVNYGWPVITYGVNYGTGTKIGVGTEKEGMAQPLYYWDPSIAPGGMTFYSGDKFPDWQGDLLVSALKFQLLARLELNDNGEVSHEEQLLKGELGRIRAIAQGPDGYIYMLIDAPNGKLVRLEPGTEKP